MKVYTCNNCQNPLYFENNICLNCQHAVGFDPATLSMITLEPLPPAPATDNGPAPAPAAGNAPAAGAQTAAVNTASAVNTAVAGSAPGTANPTAAQMQPAPGTQPLPAAGIQPAPAEQPAPPAPAPLFSNVSDDSDLYRYCRNAEYGTCNWLIPSSSADPYCVACAMNHFIPNLTTEQNSRRWKNMEVAKHRLIYSLLRLRIPLSVKHKNGDLESIIFDFKADAPTGERVLTGHDNGTITINIEEADEAQRAKHKLDLGERYRTLLGHFRHEIGHFYWDVLIMETPALEKYRQIFGDERKDYGEALKVYYQTGAPADWNQRFISPYATSHPWEDWAETWAHYLHMMDTLETAWVFGMKVNSPATPANILQQQEAAKKARAKEKKGADKSKTDGGHNVIQDPYSLTGFDEIIKMWLPLCFALNSLNRSMGHPDFYPFVISTPVIEKLRFIHEICTAQAHA